MPKHSLNNVKFQVNAGKKKKSQRIMRMEVGIVVALEKMLRGHRIILPLRNEFDCQTSPHCTTEAKI